MTAQNLFKAMIRDQIAPALRELGFRGSRHAYLLPSDTHRAMLSFQKSAFSTADHVRFAVNFGVITKQEWEERRRAFGAPERPTPSWLTSGSIGDRVADGPVDGSVQHWWDLRVGDPLRPLADDVLARIKQEALPAIRTSIAETSG